MDGKILGIDPGTRIAGYGVLSLNPLDIVDYGCIKPPSNASLEEKYLYLHEAFQQLIALHTPSYIAVEEQFIHKNVKSSMKLYGVNAALMIASAKAKIPLSFYSATEGKKAVTGHGLASKQALKRSLEALFQIDDITPEDASDALALAYCHANRVKWQSRCTTILQDPYRKKARRKW